MAAAQIVTRKRTIYARSLNQDAYMRALERSELVFGIGPAGTGKTYLAVAQAAMLLERGMVERIVLSRPAVEAGERLGFLPGDMKEKVDPYLQAALRRAERHYSRRSRSSAAIDARGRSRSRRWPSCAAARWRNAYVMLDEAQNATTMQMKMFLTRLGEGSRMAVTGDTTQIDLPRGVTSGLVEAERILEGVPGVGFTRFTAEDVVRHPLVARIVGAYDRDAKMARGFGATSED